MIDPIFTGSLVAGSIVLPVLAWRVNPVRWILKAPFCLVLANLIPFLAVELFEPNFRYGPMTSVAIFMHLAISGFIIFFLAGALSHRALK